MNARTKLPIVVAVTGHRDIRVEDEALLEATVRTILTGLRTRYAASPLVVLTPLAVGADRLVARVASALDIPFRAPLPLAPDEYRKDFDVDERAEFDRLLAMAESSFVVPFAGDNDSGNVGEPARRALQYAAVGAYLARVAHVLLALYDGKASDAVGGTAAIVDYRLFGVPAMFREDPTALDPPESGPVYHILTPRATGTSEPGIVGELQLRSRFGAIDDVERDPFRPLYVRIERFNRDVDRFAKAVPAEERRATVVLRSVAEILATRYQRAYHAALAVIFIASGVGAVALAVAHADHPHYALVLVYIVLFVLASVAFVIADRGRWKDRFIEYRALEIALSVQEHWDVVGIDACAADFYLRLQRSDLDWIRSAVRSVHDLDIGTPADPSAGIAAVRDFVTTQRAFFERTKKRDRARGRAFEIATWIAIAVDAVLSIVLGAIAFGVEITHVDSPYGDDLIRWIAIAAIIAAVLHEYPRRRAYHAQARRYETMFALYDRAVQVLDEHHDASIEVRLTTTRDVAREIGREALAENGDWVVMHRELPIELLHV